MYQTDTYGSYGTVQYSTYCYILIYLHYITYRRKTFEVLKSSNQVNHQHHIHGRMEQETTNVWKQMQVSGWSSPVRIAVASLRFAMSVFMAIWFLSIFFRCLKNTQTLPTLRMFTFDIAHGMFTFGRNTIQAEVLDGTSVCTQGSTSSSEKGTSMSISLTTSATLRHQVESQNIKY